jgi:hypothetical protein
MRSCPWKTSSFRAWTATQSSDVEAPAPRPPAAVIGRLSSNSALTAAITAGCAGTEPKPQFSREVPDARISLPDSQFHIDGNVVVYQMPDHVMVGEFALRKTFAWGGIYGTATSMKNIEDAFSDGVAAAVTGQKEEAPKQKS